MYFTFQLFQFADMGRQHFHLFLEALFSCK